nr:keratin, type I cytoskeletal 9-like [Procambarus clarkii]
MKSTVDEGDWWKGVRVDARAAPGGGPYICLDTEPRGSCPRIITMVKHALILLASMSVIAICVGADLSRLGQDGHGVHLDGPSGGFNGGGIRSTTTRPGANGGGIRSTTIRPGANGGGIRSTTTRPGANGGGIQLDGPSGGFNGGGIHADG